MCEFTSQGASFEGRGDPTRSGSAVPLCAHRLPQHGGISCCQSASVLGRPRAAPTVRLLAGSLERTLDRNATRLSVSCPAVAVRHRRPRLFAIESAQGGTCSTRDSKSWRQGSGRIYDEHQMTTTFVHVQCVP